MAFRLHVWGPAFGLASVDAECLAAVTYLAYALPPSRWELVASSPSGVPTHAVPALYDTASQIWVSGFTALAAYLARLDPAWHLDAHLSPSQRADATAYATFLSSAAAPLVALSLYVSSANWAGATRPAYSTILPFPLTWTEPPAVRRRMCDAAAHLGLSDLNIDEQPSERAADDTRGFLKVPERLRPRSAGVKASLSPEQTALFRLEATGRECLGVLADLLKSGQQQGGEQQQQQQRFFLGGARPTTLDCLAFGYLALMLVPEVPRPWLRDLMRGQYECLCVFVDGVRDELFGGDVASSLPWRRQPPAEAAADPEGDGPLRITRFARGVVRAAVPGDWLLGGAGGPPAAAEGRPGAGAVLSALGSSVAGLGLVGGVLLYRHLSPFGSLLYRWELQRRSLGPAGVFL